MLLFMKFIFLMVVVTVNCGIAPVNNLILNLQQKNKAVHDALELLSQEQAEEAVMIHEAERKRRFLQEKKEIYEKATGDEIVQIQKAKRSYLKAEQTLENLIKAEEILKMYDKKLYEAKMRNHDLIQNLIQLQDERTNTQMEYISQGFPLEGMLIDIQELNDKNIKILSSCTYRQTEEPPVSGKSSSIKCIIQKDRPSQNIFTSNPLLTEETHLLNFNNLDLKKKERNARPWLPMIPVIVQPNCNAVKEVKKRYDDVQHPLNPNHTAVTKVKKRYDVISPIYRTYFKNFVVARRPLYSLVPAVQGSLYPNLRAITEAKKYVIPPIYHTFFKNLTLLT